LLVNRLATHFYIAHPPIAALCQFEVKCQIMSTISVRVEKSGRVLIPAAVRRKLGLKEGESDLLLRIDETPVGVTTRSQALARIQKWAAGYSVPGRVFSEELLEERRKEAIGEFGS
jgi:AbrB family looped-hinge helix DNA binding protein